MDWLKLYIKIRCLQAFRFLQDAGWFNVLLLLPIAGIVLLALLEQSLYGDFPATGLVVLITAGSIHLQRKDSDFLHRLGPSSWLLRWIDYLLLAIPFIISLLIVASYRDIALVLLVLPFLALIRPPEGLFVFRNTIAMDFLPIEAIEWRAALRKNGWWLLLVYLLALGMSKHEISGIGITLVLAIAAMGFYDKLEEKELMEVFLPIDRFLQRKAYWQALVFHGLLLPHYLLFLYFHLAYWYLLLVAVLVGQSMLCFALFYKYAQWRPHQYKAYNQMAVGFYTGGLIVPFLAPASLFYCWVYYRKAQKNLEYYYGRNK